MVDGYLERTEKAESISQFMSIEEAVKDVPILNKLAQCETYSDLVALEQAITPAEHSMFYKRVEIKYYKQRLVLKIDGHPLKTIDLPSIS
jgi:hypothetical protein